MSCVISSFITKPQLRGEIYHSNVVALYPLSSPNHNSTQRRFEVAKVALYPLSSPNHNCNRKSLLLKTVALYPLSSPNHNLPLLFLLLQAVALYPLSSPNHNLSTSIFTAYLLRYILFHHQTTTP